MAFLATPKQGYLVEICAEPPEKEFEHTLGGENELAGAVCLPCKRPYLRMMSLDVRDPRLGLSFPRGRVESPLDEKRPLHDLPLLYCWSCGPCLDYRVNPEGGIDVLNHSKEASWPDSCWPYEPYPKTFPRKYLRLTPMSDRGQDVICKNNAGELNREDRWTDEIAAFLKLKHQIGGEPYIQQGYEGADCTLCNQPASFVAAVAETTGSKKKFFDYGVQVFFAYCAPCQVVSAMHECD